MILKIKSEGQTWISDLETKIEGQNWKSLYLSYETRNGKNFIIEIGKTKKYPLRFAGTS